MFNITDLFGSCNVNKNTPFIKLSVPTEYLRKINASLFEVDTNRLRGLLHHDLPYIDRFIPVGLVELKHSQTNVPILMANRDVVPTTSVYEQIENGIWVGISKNKNKISKSLGTFVGQNMPQHIVPVFSNDYLINTDATPIEYNVYSAKIYGHRMLNKYKFVQNRMTEKNNIDEYNQKIYFTAQGGIAKDFECMNDNNKQLFLNECNAKESNDLFQLNYPLENFVYILDDELSNNMKVVFKNKQSRHNIVLKESDTPWFLDKTIMGDAVDNTTPHKVTGILTCKPSTNNNITNEQLRNSKLFFDSNNVIIFIILFFLISLLALKYVKT